MPVFQLNPRNLKHPSWAASERQERARVRADTSHDARHMAACEWGVFAPFGRDALIPWIDKSPVECVCVDEDDDGPPAILED